MLVSKHMQYIRVFWAWIAYACYFLLNQWARILLLILLPKKV